MGQRALLEDIRSRNELTAACVSMGEGGEEGRAYRQETCFVPAQGGMRHGATWSRWSSWPPFGADSASFVKYREDGTGEQGSRPVFGQACELQGLSWRAGYCRVLECFQGRAEHFLMHVRGAWASSCVLHDDPGWKNAGRIMSFSFCKRATVQLEKRKTVCRTEMQTCGSLQLFGAL